jgi:hypothetical protein
MFGGDIPYDMTADPIDDCYRWVKNNGGSEYAYLIDTKGKRMSDFRLSYPKDVVFSNGLRLAEGSWKSEVLVYTSMALKHLKGLLSQYPEPGTPLRDENWPKYMFGDITHPETGVILQSASYKSDTGNTFNGFQIGASNKRLQEVRELPVTEAQLEARADLGSLDVLNIPSYQEIVDFIVRDGSIPLEVIKQACGHMANIDDASAGTLVSRNKEASAEKEKTTVHHCVEQYSNALNSAHYK